MIVCNSSRNKFGAEVSSLCRDSALPSWCQRRGVSCCSESSIISQVSSGLWMSPVKLCFSFMHRDGCELTYLLGQIIQWELCAGAHPRAEKQASKENEELEYYFLKPLSLKVYKKKLVECNKIIHVSTALPRPLVSTKLNLVWSYSPSKMSHRSRSCFSKWKEYENKRRERPTDPLLKQQLTMHSHLWKKA